jgi:hypothetical protein
MYNLAKRNIYNKIVRDGLLLQLILDPTMDSITSVIKLKYKNYMDIEQITIENENIRERIWLLVTGYWYLPPLLGALPLGFNIKISLKVSFKNKMNA